MITTLVFAPADMPLVLTNCDPTVTQDNANKYGAPLLAIANRYGITTPLRMAHFLAQILHESGSLKYTEELASGAAYEGNKGLGNIQRGDGKRFKGRGLIQVSGRSNYRRYAQLSGIDVIARPEAMAELPASVDSAGWFWRHGNGDCNNAADKDNLLAVTRIINGGTRGYADRQRKLKQCKSTLETAGALLVQEALNATRSYPELRVDGDFGPRSASIVRELQSDHFIQVTGIVDSLTWSKLRKG